MKKILAILGTLGVAASIFTTLFIPDPFAQMELGIEQEKRGVISLFTK